MSYPHVFHRVLNETLLPERYASRAFVEKQGSKSLMQAIWDGRWKTRCLSPQGEIEIKRYIEISLASLGNIIT